MGMQITTVKFDTDTKTILKRVADSLENIERCLANSKYTSENAEELRNMEPNPQEVAEIAYKSVRDYLEKNLDRHMANNLDMKDLL